MRPSAITPTGVETTFADNQIIVSKTDPKGIITYVNDVFLQVSKFDEEECIGQPHSLIRHPDMPRAVFALLWQQIQAGEEIFAYVMNICKDGAHYWVLAHVTPTIIDGRTIGYHSNRRTPTPQALAAIKPLYAQMVSEERRHARPQEAIAASTQLLHNAIAEGGFSSYDEFVWSLEPEMETV